MASRICHFEPGTKLLSREKLRKGVVEWSGFVPVEGKKTKEFEVHVKTEDGSVRHLPWDYFLRMWRTEDEKDDWLLLGQRGAP